MNKKYNLDPKDKIHEKYPEGIHEYTQASKSEFYVRTIDALSLNINSLSK